MKQPLERPVRWLLIAHLVLALAISGILIAIALQGGMAALLAIPAAAILALYLPGILLGWLIARLIGPLWTRILVAIVVPPSLLVGTPLILRLVG